MGLIIAIIALGRMGVFGFWKVGGVSVMDGLGALFWLIKNE